MEDSVDLMNSFSISVIIPVYDVSLYIERCIKSVIAQQYTHFECIIVDDASPDDSIEKCERIIAEGGRGNVQFTIIRHKENRGLSAARNTGTLAATGDYVYYLDADDELLPDSLERIIEPIRHDHSIEMVIGGYMRFINDTNKDQVKLEEKNYHNNETVRESFYNRTFYGYAWNKLVKKSFLEKNNLFFKEGTLWEDTLWSFYVMKYLNHMYSIQEVTYCHYIRPKSITTGISDEDRINNLGAVYQEIAENFTNGEEAKEAKRYLHIICFLLLQDPYNYPIQHAFALFHKALSEGNLYFDVCKLSIFNYMSKNKTSRKICLLYMKTKQMIISKKKSFVKRLTFNTINDIRLNKQR